MTIHINMIKKIFPLTIYFLIVLILFGVHNPIVYALSPEQQKLYDSGIYYYDKDVAVECNTEAQSANAIDNTSVYVIGDSYGDGYKDDLTKKLKAEGYNPIDYDISVSRSISGAGQNPNTSGLDAVKKNQDKIKTAGTIIIQLGTNPENNFDKNLKQIMDDINKINPAARKFWVNVGNRSVAVASQNKTNKSIADNASYGKYTVIDWNKIAEDKYFAADKIHPSSSGGWNALATLIANTLGPVTSPTPDPLTSKNKTSKYFKDNANAAKAYAYLLSKGLTPVQVVSILGNLYGESGIIPDNPENGNSKVPVNGVGFGIAQWTFTSRQSGLVKMAKEQNKPPTDLGVQLDYLWYEMTHGYKKSVLEPLKKITDLRAGWWLVIDKFESPADWTRPGREAKDIPKAKEYLKEFAGITASDIGSDSSNGCPSDASSSVAGAGGWDLKGPNALSQQAQDDKKWSGDPFSNCGTIGQCGCWAVTAANVISTLSDKKITPGELVKKYGSTTWAYTPEDYGLKVKKIDKDLDKAAETLKAGGLVQIYALQGTFTSNQHMFILRKVSDDGNKFYVYTLYNGDKRNDKAYTRAELNGMGALVEMYAVTKK